MNCSQTITRFWINSFFILISFVLVFAFTLPINAEPEDCVGGTAGIGGPNIPDINSDGCVDEADLSILIHCWGATLADPIHEDCRVDSVALFSVTISPSPDSLFQGANNRQYDVKANGGNGVNAGDVTFFLPPSQCPSGATCSLAQITCTMPEAGDCTVKLNINNTDSTPLGNYQVIVTGTHTDGLSDDGVLDLTITPPPNTFVTSGSHTGNIAKSPGSWLENFNSDCGGITWDGNNAAEASNCICTYYANNSSVMLPGEYHAWISYNIGGSLGTGVNAISNISSTENQTMTLIRRDGAVIADNPGALISAPLQKPINMTQQGIQVPNGYVWTGTEVDGTLWSGGGTYNCEDGGTATGYGWAEGSTNARGIYGVTAQTGPGWTYANTALCNQSYRLYCIWHKTEINPDWGGIIPLAPVVNNFEVVAGSAIISWEVESNPKFPLDRIEIWRAPDEKGIAGDWIELRELRQELTGTDTFLHSRTVEDNPLPGTWWYGLHAVDSSEQVGIEDAPIPLVVPGIDLGF